MPEKIDTANEKEFRVLLFVHFFKFPPIPNPNSDSGDGMSQAEPLINFLLYFYGKISRVLFQEAALLTFEWMSVSPLQPFVSTPRLFRDALVNTDFLQRTFRDSHRLYPPN